MRTLTPAALAKIATQFGNEPINVVSIQWTDGCHSWYTDRKMASFLAGKILEISALDSVVNISNSMGSSEISIKLDDTDGTIKEILNTIDVHFKKVQVYQWFSGLAFSDSFLIFSGVVNSPIVWNEQDRSVSLSAISRLEDKEIGFSAEEGQFTWLPSDLVGKMWPLCFGTVADYPALKITKAVSGILATGFGVTSGQNNKTLWQIANTGVIFQKSNPTQVPDDRVATEQRNFLGDCADAFDRGADAAHQYKNTAAELSYTQQAESLRQQMSNIEDQINEQWAAWDKQEACRRAKELQANQDAICQANQQAQTTDNEIPISVGPSIIRVIGGEDFPQGVGLTLSIGNALVTGSFSGQYFHISSSYIETDQDAADKEATQKFSPSTCPVYHEPYQCEQIREPIYYSFSMMVPGEDKDFLIPTLRESSGSFEPYDSEPQQSSRPIGNSGEYNLQNTWIEPGTTVTIASDENIYYVASTIPGNVKAVKAFQQLPGQVRKLAIIPSNYYYLTQKIYGPITAEVVVLVKPLSSYSKEGWEDDIYVTMESSVGPNIIDILIYLITNYTSLTYDVFSFFFTKIDLLNFPANFPVLDQKNILEILQEIAFQARCALWIDNDIFYIKYMATEHLWNTTVTLGDIDFETGLEVSLTPTEDLVTKYIAKWHLTWADTDPLDKETKGGIQKIVLRHNVKKYGIKEEEYDFYIYNSPDIVYKVATFWLIRKSNSWKRIKFSTFLQKLDVETFDNMLLDFGTETFVATSTVNTIIEKASYNSDTHLIDFECALPIRSGEMTKYPFYWPATLPYGTTFPTATEIAEGWAGGNGIGKDATGVLPIGYVPNQPGTIFIGGVNIGYGPHSDYGDRHPTDVGFVPRSTTDATTGSGFTSSPKPATRLTYSSITPAVVTLAPYSELKLPPIPPSDVFGISLDTIISDTDNQASAPLKSFFKECYQDKLIADTEALWSDTEHQQDAAKKFEFKYSDDDEKFGAGIAFLTPSN